MTKTRIFLAVSLAMSAGTGAVSCTSFSSGSDGSGGSSPTSGSGGSGQTGTGGSSAGVTTYLDVGSVPAGTLPCDVLGAAGNACVAAHSTVRVLVSGYTGPLYQICKGTFTAGPNSCTSGMTMDIGSVAGYADAASQDTFCSGTCTISIIYDQSGMKNDLRPAPAGGQKKTPDNPVSATALPIMAGGHKAYGVFIKAGLGYRSGCTGCMNSTPTGTAKGDDPETEYMVVSQSAFNNSCCFDYGNAEVSAIDDGNGTMEAVYYGSGVIWGTGFPGGRTYPWIMADLENGLYAGWEKNQDQAISTNTPIMFPFISGVVVGDTADKNGGKGRFAIYAGDATQGALIIKYDGIRPAKPGYVPMQKQGSIILGIGGDNSNGATGQFFEGVMATGAASTDTLMSLQASIVAANYGQ